jgi:hypothetical protein
MEYVYHHGNEQIQCMAFNSGRTDVGHQACALQVMCGVQTHSAADVTKELDIHWIVHRIVQDQLDYREFCQIVGVHVAGASITITPTILGVFRAAVFSCGRTSTAKRNSG